MSPRLIVVLLLTLVAVFSFQAAPGEPIRAVGMVSFMLVAPGLAWIATADHLGLVGYAALVVSLSVAFDILIATTLLFASLWSPELGFALLVFFAALGLLATEA